MRILAVDPGTARVGLALSDEGEVLASPHGILAAGRQAAGRVAAVAAEVGAGRVVVGLPLNMDGTEGPGAQAARELASAIRAASGLPVELWDERLTTRMANAAPERWLKPDRHAPRRAARRETRGRRGGADDSRAAAVILQSFLDRNREAHP